jgi:hypothetical protein
MIKLVQHDAEGPDIRFWAVHIMMNAFRRHVERRAYIEIVEQATELKKTYMECTANPKSAILATPLFRKTLAIFKSL